MSMHMIRGVQVHGRHKAKRKPGWREAMAHHEAFLKKMGVKGGASDYRIGTMHKSNAVPVTRKKDAEDMAKMRR